ncbi:hypothetical protein TNCV_1346261 [Trichonephila clavipes]|nr:hypothetical protein TNCV_1346261 [Trichonephila clavipes]
MNIPIRHKTLTFSSGRLIDQVYPREILPTWTLGIMKVWTSSLRRLGKRISHPLFTSEDANVVTNPKISNQRFKKPIIPELNCPRNLSSTVARLPTDHFNGMEITPDNSRSYPIYRNCPQIQLTPDYIFDCKVIFTSLFKLYASPQDILYNPQVPDLALPVIGAFGPI